MKKPNGHDPIGEPFFPVIRSLFNTDKYRALWTMPAALFVLQMLMQRHDHRKNNGLVSLSCREVAAWYQTSTMTAWRAFQRLQKDGFITEVHKGHLVPQVGRPNVSTLWRINFHPYTSKEKAAPIDKKPQNQIAKIAQKQR